MNRDMDLIRDILLKIESIPTPGPHPEFAVEGCEPPKLHHHLGLLRDAGLIKAIDISNLNDGRKFMPIDLTNNGHDFLDTARDKNIWEQAKQFIKNKGIGHTIEGFKAVLEKITMDRLIGH